jgi:ABC-type multidrug transport system fused ATPase/permease subunit
VSIEQTTSSVLLLRLWRHLSHRRRRQFILVCVFSLVSALAEVVSLGAVLPFLGVLTAPDRVLGYPFIAHAARAWGITAPSQLLLPLTVIFVAVAVAAAVIRMGVLWAGTRFTFATGADIGIEVYRRSLYQSYSTHVSRNSSEVISGILAKVGGVVLGVILPLMTLISSVLVLVGVMAALLAINARLALIATGVFGAAYLSITAVSRRRLEHNSRRVADGYTQLVKALQEGLGAIRDVLLDNTQEFYCAIYERADHQFRLAQGENIVIGLGPRYLMEMIVMVLVAITAYALSQRAGGLAAALPMLGALALGAQRMLPALQQAFNAWANMAGTHASLADTIELLDQPLPPQTRRAVPAAMRFQSSVRFSAVRFRYASTAPWVLDGFNLTIRKGARIGLIGSTGCGKTTAMDLLMGLLSPTEGEVLVDEAPLQGERVRAWQQAIAHVPQNLYLADATVAENIAFGVSRDDVDLGRVQRAAQQAQIATFLEKQPEGYQTPVGERGVRLSGGQRQRIGIARALYKRASVLVLDEATSALDSDTERSVMDAIEGLDRDLTIIVVAHRLTTVRRCDTIVELAGGMVGAVGSYEEVLGKARASPHADAARPSPLMHTS